MPNFEEDENEDLNTHKEVDDIFQNFFYSCKAARQKAYQQAKINNSEPGVDVMNFWKDL